MNDENRWHVTAKVTWFGVGEGGRASGPPTGALFSPTLVFTSEKDGGAGIEGLEQFSVVMGMVATFAYSSVVNLRFLAPDLVARHIVPGAEIFVMEGRRPVGKATITAALREH